MDTKKPHHISFVLAAQISNLSRTLYIISLPLLVLEAVFHSILGALQGNVPTQYSSQTNFRFETMRVGGTSQTGVRNSENKVMQLFHLELCTSCIKCATHTTCTSVCPRPSILGFYMAVHNYRI